jgi:TRAP-type C4-dicarboxylate transport system substrate-binding protein
MSEAETAKQIATLAENGMTVVPPSEALAAALAMAGEQMTAEWLERAGDQGAAIVEAFQAAQ